MKILTNKKQQYLMDLISKAQKSAERDDFITVTACLAELACEVLTFKQLCILIDDMYKKEIKE